MYLAKSFIVPAIYLFINHSSQATAYYSPIIYLQLKLSVKIHKEPGETLTHSVLLFLHSLIPPRFDCIDRHEHLFSLSLWLLCRPNRLGNLSHSAHIRLLWSFRMLSDIIFLYIRVNVCHAIVFAVIGIF